MSSTEPASRRPDAPLQSALDLFDLGRGDEALQILTELHQSEPRSARLRSYYGLCLATVERRFEDGLKHCHAAAKQEFFNPELYLNLARLHLGFGFKVEGVRYLRRGLMIDPGNADLNRALENLGDRVLPVLGFLPRRHPVNRLLGRVRHRLLGRERGAIAA